MDALDLIRQKIRFLYEHNPNIHINLTMTHPKVDLKNSPAVIRGIYPHVFRIEECVSGYPQCHTLQYKEILTGQIEIVELKEAFPG